MSYNKTIVRYCIVVWLKYLAYSVRKLAYVRGWHIFVGCSFFMIFGFVKVLNANMPSMGFIAYLRS